jgi:hypothetical protein
MKRGKKESNGKIEVKMVQYAKNRKLTIKQVVEE